MDINKVLYVTQEMDPYLPGTPMGVYGRSVAQALQLAGGEVRTFMPKYGAVNERRNQLHEVIRLSGLNIIIDDTDHPLVIKVATLQPTRLQVYFIDNDDYFFRTEGNVPEIVADSAANDERTIFFVRGVFETVKKLRWEPNVVQCTGWMTALLPFYLRHIYFDDPAFRNAKVVYTLTNDAFEGTLDSRMSAKLAEHGFDPKVIEGLADFDWMELNKLAISHADAIVIGTPDVPAGLLDYAAATGKPLLPYGDDGNSGAHAAFFSTL